MLYQLFFKLSLKRSFKIIMVNADRQLKSIKEYRDFKAQLNC